MTDYRTPLMRSQALRLAEYDRNHHGGHLADMLEAVANGSDESAAFRPARLEDIPTEGPGACAVDAEFRCWTCGTCMGCDGCEDQDHPLGPDDCPDCRACVDCVKRCAWRRGEEVAR